MNRYSRISLILCFLLAAVSGPARGADSIILSPVSDLEWQTNPRGASFSYPWKENGGRHGDVVRFPAGFDSGPHTHTVSYRGVVIQGELMNPAKGKSTSVRLPPGSTWFVAGGVVHSTKCVSDQECIFYIHQDSDFDFNPVP